MSTLKGKLIRLAYTQENLRTHLLPLLRKALTDPSRIYPYHLSMVKQDSAQGKPWRVYLAMVEGGHSKFWEAFGTGRGSVTIQWGRIGSRGRAVQKDWAYVEKILPVKLRKGYEYSNPHLAKAMGGKGEITPKNAQTLATYASMALAINQKNLTNYIDVEASKFLEDAREIEVNFGVDLSELTAAFGKMHATYHRAVEKEIVRVKTQVQRILKVKVAKRAGFWDSWKDFLIGNPEEREALREKNRGRNLPPKSEVKKAMESIGDFYQPYTDKRGWRYILQEIPRPVSDAVNALMGGDAGTETEGIAEEIVGLVDFEGGTGFWEAADVDGVVKIHDRIMTYLK